MEVEKRKAESGRIWKNYGKSRENDGKGDRQRKEQKIISPGAL
jgi:hypothetical protein